MILSSYSKPYQWQFTNNRKLNLEKATIDSLNRNDQNKDEIIKEKEQAVQNLRYKLKDAQETYEVKFLF